MSNYSTNKTLASGAGRETAYKEHRELKTLEEDLLINREKDEISLKESCYTLQNQIGTLK